MGFFGHLKTVTRHRHLVMAGCFKIGLYWQGLTHDLSKFSPEEFLVGAKYYQGTRSPNVAEREEKGFSTAWMHHKGRNKHHFEYWTDLKPGSAEYVPVPMPNRYLAEMVMDRIAACKTYKGKSYTDAAALEYFQMSREKSCIHPETAEKLRFLLTMLRDHGEEETFTYIRNVVLKDIPFPKEASSES